MLRHATRRTFGLFSGLRDAVRTPIKHVNKLFESGRGDHSPINNLTEKFEDEASEWKAIIVENAYELNTFQNPEQIIQGNFGTVDNPHLIFTSDIPYRMVGCTGAPGEDDYEGHEIMYFMLREGPLQRCGSCGQVFKLVRLRDEDSTENEYYKRDFVAQGVEEMGEADHWIQLNAIRFMMLHSYEHTHFEVATDAVTSLKNHDDHDRILVDPAYRLEQLKIAKHKAHIVNEVERGIYHAIDEQYGTVPLEYTKDNYENLVNIEIAVARLEKHFKAVQRFNIRKFLDPANHERREKRMQQRAHERINKAETFYVNGHTEGELQYRDYYESDSEALAMLDIDPNQEKERIMARADLQAKKFDFVEEYANVAGGDGSSFLDKKIFRFNYRQAFYSHEDHERKEARMRAKIAASGFSDKIAQLSQQNAEKLVKGEVPKDSLKYYDLAVAQAIDNYKTYFESDLEEDFAYVESLPLAEKRAFIQTLDDNGFIEPAKEEVAAIHVARFRDMESGAIASAVEFLDNMNNEVGASMSNLTGVNQNHEMLEKAMREVNEKIKAAEKELNKL